MDMEQELRAKLKLILKPLEAIIISLNDEPLKVQLERIYTNASQTLDELKEENETAGISSNGGNLPSFDQELVERAFRFVEENLLNPSYSVEQLSRDMNMDRTGLYRKLVVLTGHAPTMFIRSIRLKKAVMLLNHKRYSQAEIAERVGFSNAAYFSKCFKEEYGVSPSHYHAG